MRGWREAIVPNASQPLHPPGKTGNIPYAGNNPDVRRNITHIVAEMPHDYTIVLRPVAT